MVRKSYGPRRGSRKKLKARKEDVLKPNRFLQRFKIGQIVHIDIIPQTPGPHHKFKGRTGRIIGKRGRAYIVEVSDLNAKKKIIVRPEHLKLMR